MVKKNVKQFQFSRWPWAGGRTKRLSDLFLSSYAPVLLSVVICTAFVVSFVAYRLTAAARADLARWVGL